MPDPSLVDIFADGGNSNNPPIQPPKSGRKSVTILRIFHGDLFIPKNHLSHDDHGLSMTHISDLDLIFVLTPMIVSLGDCPMSGTPLYDSLDVCAKSIPNSSKRGSAIKIVRDHRKKYICIGSSAKCFKKGINIS